MAQKHSCKGRSELRPDKRKSQGGILGCKMYFLLIYSSVRGGERSRAVGAALRIPYPSDSDFRGAA